MMLSEQTENEVRKYKVTIPATIHVTVSVLAEDEDEAKLKAQRLVETAAEDMADECLEQAEVYYPPDVDYAQVDDVEDV